MRSEEKKGAWIFPFSNVFVCKRIQTFECLHKHVYYVLWLYVCTYTYICIYVCIVSYVLYYIVLYSFILYVCMYVYIHMYICMYCIICIVLYSFILYVCMYVYIPMYCISVHCMYVCMCLCIHTYVYICMYVRIHTYVYIYVLYCIVLYVRIHTYVYMYVLYCIVLYYMYVCMFTYICMYCINIYCIVLYCMYVGTYTYICMCMCFVCIICIKHIVCIIYVCMFFSKKKYPFISVNSLQNFKLYVVGGRNNQFGGWKCQKGVLFLELMNGVVVHTKRNSWHWVVLASESPTIPSQRAFKVWATSNQIFATNSVGDALTWWKTREHRAFPMVYTIVLLNISHNGWISFLIPENCRDSNGSARTLPDLA